MHPLLARQIDDCTGPDGTLDLERFKGLVGDAYRDDERARHRLERAMRLMDEEMAALNAEIARQAYEAVARFILGASYPLMILDRHGTVFFTNKLVGQMLGCRGRDLTGKPFEALLVDGPDLQSLVEVIESPMRFRRTDGTMLDTLVAVTRADLADTSFYIISIRDETERLERLALIESAREAAENANRAKSAFLAMMSHELRTPLNALLGSADLLARTPLDPRQSDYVRMFNEAGQLMLALLNDVLDYSKIEAGQLELEPAPFSPAAMLREVEGLWGPQAANRGLAFEVTVPEELPPMLLGDGMRLRQVLFNLVSNAIKFTASGSVRVTTQVQLQGGMARLAIAVTDTGIGIPQDRLAGIFSPFVQADSSMTRRFGGTGLGLSIARSLARQMDGELSASSQTGSGSTFLLEVALPVSGRTVEEHHASEEIDAPELRVLAVDDNALNRQILAAMLDLWPVSTMWATNGVEALDILAQERFDVVLMDVQMPVLDGLSATRQLRASEGPNRRVPVIALTANAREEDRASCLAAGMTDFLTKPVRPQALLEALARVDVPDLEPARQHTAVG